MPRNSENPVTGDVSKGIDNVQLTRGYSTDVPSSVWTCRVPKLPYLPVATRSIQCADSVSWKALMSALQAQFVFIQTGCGSCRCALRDQHGPSETQRETERRAQHERLLCVEGEAQRDRLTNKRTQHERFLCVEGVAQARYVANRPAPLLKRHWRHTSKSMKWRTPGEEAIFEGRQKNRKRSKNRKQKIVPVSYETDVSNSEEHVAESPVKISVVVRSREEMSRTATEGVAGGHVGRSAGEHSVAAQTHEKDTPQIRYANLLPLLQHSDNAGKSVARSKSINKSTTNDVHLDVSGTTWSRHTSKKALSNKPKTVNVCRWAWGCTEDMRSSQRYRKPPACPQQPPPTPPCANWPQPRTVPPNTPPRRDVMLISLPKLAPIGSACVAQPSCWDQCATGHGHGPASRGWGPASHSEGPASNSEGPA